MQNEDQWTISIDNYRNTGFKLVIQVQAKLLGTLKDDIC